MAVIIKIKKPVNSVSLKNPPHGKNSPNKVINIGISSKDIAKGYIEHNIYILKPIIDRIVLRFDPTKDWSKNKKKKFDKFVRSYIHDYAQTGDWAYEYVPNEVQSQNKSWFRSYNCNVWLKHKESGEKILIQTIPKSSKTPFFRFDFNPSKLGPKGIAFFKEELAFLMCKEEFDLSYKDILEAENLITRLDIAVDILGADVSDLGLSYNKHGSQKKQVKPVVYYSETGRAETNYPNALLSGSNNTYVYNKKAEVKDKNKPKLYDDALHSRFEHRYERLSKPMSYLLKITVGKNPLKKMNLLWINYEAIKDKPFSHVLFLQYARERGKEKALEVIPENEQDDYRETYEEAMVDIWQPSELWEHWPDMVKAYGLLQE